MKFRKKKDLDAGKYFYLEGYGKCQCDDNGDLILVENGKYVTGVHRFEDKNFDELMEIFNNEYLCDGDIKRFNKSLKREIKKKFKMKYGVPFMYTHPYLPSTIFFGVFILSASLLTFVIFCSLFL